MSEIQKHLFHPKFPWKTATILYGVSYIPSLLSAKSLFWDDWALTNSKTGKIESVQYLTSGAAPWRAFFEDIILRSSPFLFRIFSLFAFFVAGYFFFQILKSINALNKAQIFAATLVFLVVPVNSARIAMINNSYAFSYLLFFAGWYLLATSKWKINYFVSLGCFFLSYTSLSLITFTLLPILYLVIVNRPKKFTDCLKLFKIVLPLCLLPIVYLITRQIYWPPTGGAAKMYTPQVLGAVRGMLFIFLCSVPLLYGVLFAKWKSDSVNKFLISFGLLSISVGAFPYMVGGHLVDISDWLIAFVPNFSDWDSRHQLLLPMGLALILVGGLNFTNESKPDLRSNAAFTTITFVFVLLNVTYAQEYFLDSLKQNSVIEAIQNLDELKSIDRILIDDQAVRFNARGRHVRSYEWEAIIQKALGERRIEVSDFQYVDCKEFQPNAILHINSPNGRLESTLRRSVSIDTYVEKINPCGN